MIGETAALLQLGLSIDVLAGRNNPLGNTGLVVLVQECPDEEVALADENPVALQ